MTRRGRKLKSYRLERKKINGNKGKLNKWNTDNMRLAMEEYFRDLNAPRRLSIHALSRAYNVPRMTLSDRIKNRTKSIGPSSGRKPTFNTETENKLAQYCIELSQKGFGLTRKLIRKLAYDYAERNNIEHRFNRQKGIAGDDWLIGFLSRHKELSCRNPEKLSAARASGMNRTVVQNHFQTLTELLVKEDILNDPKYIYNLDETGVVDIFDDGAEVISPSTGRVFQITTKEKGQTTTILTSVCANGDVAPTMVIFKGKLVKSDWQEHVPIGWVVRCTESGWVSNEKINEYGEHFVQHIERKRISGDLDKNKKVLLLLDGHTTHSMNLPFLEMMRDNNIIVFSFPSHTSQWLQPLDKSVFASFKQNWNSEGLNFVRKYGGRSPQKLELLDMMVNVYMKTFTKDTIVSSFQITGACPLSYHIIPESAFKASDVSQRLINQSAQISAQAPHAMPSSIDVTQRLIVQRNQMPSQAPEPMTNSIDATKLSIDERNQMPSQAPDSMPSSDATQLSINEKNQMPSQAPDSMPSSGARQLDQRNQMPSQAPDPMTNSIDVTQRPIDQRNQISAKPPDVMPSSIYVTQRSIDQRTEISGEAEHSFEKILPCPVRERKFSRRRKTPTGNLVTTDHFNLLKETGNKKNVKIRKKQGLQGKATKSTKLPPLEVSLRSNRAASKSSKLPPVEVSLRSNRAAKFIAFAALKHGEPGSSGISNKENECYENVPRDHEIRSSRENYCTICDQFYYDQKNIEDWLQCTNCLFWQHETCANMIGKNLHGYICRDCDD